MTTNGTAESSLSLPNLLPLVGLVLHHQMIPFEIAAANLVAATATNSLRLTVGRF